MIATKHRRSIGETSEKHRKQFGEDLNDTQKRWKTFRCKAGETNRGDRQGVAADHRHGINEAYMVFMEEG